MPLFPVAFVPLILLLLPLWWPILADDAVASVSPPFWPDVPLCNFVDGFPIFLVRIFGHNSRKELIGPVKLGRRPHLLPQSRFPYHFAQFLGAPASVASGFLATFHFGFATFSDIEADESRCWPTQIGGHKYNNKRLGLGNELWVDPGPNVPGLGKVSSSVDSSPKAQ